MYAPAQTQVPVYHLEPDNIILNPNFRVYNFEGTIPAESEFLNAHRKDHYLLVFTRSGTGRQWVDMTPYTFRPNTIYFTGLHQVIVKEELNNIYSTGIAFTPAFLALEDNASLCSLPLLQESFKGFDLPLTSVQIQFVETQLALINEEYNKPGEWQTRMLTAHLTVLLTYLSRLFNSLPKQERTWEDQLMITRFREKVNEHFRERHEVGDYAPLLNLSAGHLSEVVKQQSGKPAIKHIHDRLVLEARRLLFHTEQSLKEIAYDLGFTDASYFNRFFKRETGHTPIEFRTSIRKMYH